MTDLTSFGDLNGPEAELVKASPEANRKIFGDFYDAKTIRSNLLKDYLSRNLWDGDKVVSPPQSLQLSNIVLLDEVDLSNSTIDTDLTFYKCEMGDIDLNHSTFGRLLIASSRGKELTALQSFSRSGVLITDSDLESITMHDAATARVFSLNDSRVEGNIDLSGYKIGSDLRFTKSKIQGDIRCINSVAQGDVILNGVEVTGIIHASRMRVEGGVFLNGNPKCSQLKLNTARIAHSVYIYSIQASTQIDCAKVHVGGSLVIDKNTACAKLDLDDANIVANLIIRDAKIEKNILCRGARIGGDIDFNGIDAEDCTISTTSVSGNVFCRNANMRGIVLITRTQIEGTVIFYEDFRCQSLHLTGSRISSNLEFRKPQIQDYITANSVVVKGDLAANDCTIKKGFRLRSAHIAGDVTLKSIVIGGRLAGDRCKIEGDLDISHSKLADATFSGAKINGNVIGIGTIISDDKNTTRPFSLYGAEIGSDCKLQDGFQCFGFLNMNNCRVRGDVVLTGKPHSPVVVGHFHAQNAVVDGALKMHKNFVARTLDLRGMHVKTIFDAEACWPLKGGLLIDGLEYANFGGDAPVDWRTRTKWLLRQRRRDYKSSQFKSQPFEQLAHVLAKTGHSSEAKKILIEKQNLMRAAGLKENAVSYLWHYLTGLVADYGYNPFKPAWLLAALILLGSLFFHDAYENNYMYPTKVRAVFGSRGEEMITAKVLPEPYPKFNSFLFSIDVFIPFVDLHQEEYWLPKQVDRLGNSNLFFVSFMWIGIFTSWFVATLVAAGITGLIKKDKE